MPDRLIRRISRLSLPPLAALFLIACGGSGAGSDTGGGGGPPPPTPLAVTAHLPNGTNQAPTNARIFLQFNKEVDLTALASAIQLLFVDTSAGTETPVPMTRVTTFDAIGGGLLAVFAPDAELMPSTSTGGTQFYRIRVPAGVNAVDGAGTASEFVADFGTALGTDDVANLPGTLIINETPFSSGITVYHNEALIDLSFGFGTPNIGAVAVLNMDAGTPEDFAPIFIAGASIDRTIDLGTPPNPTTTYAATLTYYDLALNQDSHSFTYVFDSEPPATPTGITLAAGSTSPTSDTSVDVEVSYGEAPSPTGISEIRVSGGNGTVTQPAMGPPTTLGVALQRNKTNSLTAVSLDAAGNASAPTSALPVVQDDLPPGLTFSFSPALTRNVETRIDTTSITLLGSTSEIAEVEILDAAAPGTPLASATVGGSFSIAFTVTADTTTTLQVRFRDDDQPENEATDGDFPVYPDTIVNPLPRIDDVLVAGTLCNSSLECSEFTGGVRTSAQRVGLRGTLEANSTLQIIGGAFPSLSTRSDSMTDVFPPAGSAEPELTLPSNVSIADVVLFATDPVGNTALESGGIEFINDTVPPLGPVPSAIADMMNCTETLASDATTDVVILLTGTFTDCTSPNLPITFSISDDPSNPSPSKGEAYGVRVDSGTIVESSLQSTLDPIALNVVLDSSYEDTRREITVVGFDAVGNERRSDRILVFHRTDSTGIVGPFVERISNVNGSESGEELPCDPADCSPTAGTIVTRPTNATILDIEGRTNPEADMVELLEAGTANVIATVTPGSGLDAMTGYFLFDNVTVPDGSVFTVLVTRGALTAEVDLDVTIDTTAPVGVPTVSLSSPQGFQGDVRITVQETQDPSGLDEWSVMASVWANAGCTTGFTGQQGIFLLDESASTSFILTGAIGEFVQVLFRDQAGNVAASGSCTEIPAGSLIAALASVSDSGVINLIDLDEPTPVALEVSDAALTDAAAPSFYSNERLFVFNRESPDWAVVNYNVLDDVVEQDFTSSGTFSALASSFDRGLLGALKSTSSSSSVLAGSVDGSGQFGGFSTRIDFPGSTASGKFTIRTFLFPATGDDREQWALVLRWDALVFAIPPRPGDVLLFDLSTGQSIVPDWPFPSPTSSGLPTGPFPLDAIVLSDGTKALVANASTFDPDPGLADLTLLDFSACATGCSISDFTATNISLAPGGTDVNGLAAIVTHPLDESLAIAVEQVDTSGTGGAVHLLDLDWAGGMVTVLDSIAVDSALAATLAVTSNGESAVVQRSSGTELIVIAIDTTTSTLTDTGVRITPAGGTFSGALLAQP